MNISFSATKEPFRARKWNLPLTYEPKIEPVKKGDCTQTIRTGRKFKVGDLIRFYIWQGKPYRSKRTTITEYMEIITVFNSKIYLEGISHDPFDGCLGYDYDPWGNLDTIARLDGIVPPTGEALRDVLISKNGKIPADGIEGQIIRWNPTPAEGRARS